MRLEVNSESLADFVAMLNSNTKRLLPLIT